MPTQASGTHVRIEAPACDWLQTAPSPHSVSVEHVVVQKFLVLGELVEEEMPDAVHQLAAFGVRFYWLVDPALGTFEVFERDAAGNYSKVIGQSEGVVGAVPGCPGLVIDLDALWSELARLADE